jgi:hypothetical protein
VLKMAARKAGRYPNQAQNKKDIETQDEDF